MRYFGNDYYSSYLSHHGIKGQKWGVRRTPEQLGHYKISDRGKLTPSEAKKCNELAKNVYNTAKDREPKITEDILTTVSKTSSEMYGLEHKIKTQKSIAAKIGADAKEKDISFEEASNKIKDAVRYTTITSENDFVNNYNYIKSSLENDGYKETKCKNYFDLYEKGEVKHKSVTSTFADPKGYEFEIQFQTQASQRAKDLKTPIYTEARNSTTSESRRKELESEMSRLAEEVPYPKDYKTIRSH